MAFTDSWTESYPAGSTPGNELDTAITQGVKRALRERLAIEHDFRDDEAGAEDTITPVGTLGMHKKCSLTVRGSDPAHVDSAIILYGKDVSAVCELFAIDESDNILQITTGGKLNAAKLGIASEAQGDIIQKGASTWERLAIGTASQQLRVNAGATALEYFTPGSTFFTGMIMLWSGSIATIPTGWVLCDGNNSTPDLRAKFVYGASDESTAGHASPGSSSSGDVVLSGNDSAVVGVCSKVCDRGDSGAATPRVLYTESNILPPYYALAYIMKT